MYDVLVLFAGVMGRGPETANHPEKVPPFSGPWNSVPKVPERLNTVDAFDGAIAIAITPNINSGFAKRIIIVLQIT
jgi:hypothetical protein